MSPTLFLALALAVPALATPDTAAPDPAPDVQASAPDTAITASIVLRVDDKNAAIAAVIEDAEARGGWFAELTGDGVKLRVPTGQAEALVEQVRGMGDVVERSYSSEDLGARVGDLESRLRAREEVLERYLAVLETARAKAVVPVEREISRVIGEIEQVKGQLRVLQDRVDHARVDVSFQFRERRAPARDGASNFPWLNTLNVADLLDAFQYGYRDRRSLVTAAPPAGFAPYARPARFQALSPDDVVYRVRSVKNKPQAELGFWKEAMKTRMVEAGYHVLHDGEVTAGGDTGYLLELGAANGEQDQTYLIALFVSGKNLIVVEASGEANRFKARRQAIVDAVAAIRL